MTINGISGKSGRLRLSDYIYNSSFMTLPATLFTCACSFYSGIKCELVNLFGDAFDYVEYRADVLRIKWFRHH